MAKDPYAFLQPHIKKLWVFLYPSNKAREARVANYFLKRVKDILTDDSVPFGEQLARVYTFLLGQKNKLNTDHRYGSMNIDFEMEGKIGATGGASIHRFQI